MEREITSEDKKAFRFFGIEAVIIIILIVVILVVLSFLGVLPWRSFIPGTSKQPATITVFPENVVKKGSLAEPVAPTIIKNAPASVTVSSLNSKYTLTLENEEEFITSVLRTLPLFGREYPSSDPAKTITVKNLSIILAESPSETFQLSDSEGIYSSAEIKLQGDTLSIKQYMAPRSIQKYGQDVSYVFQGSVLFNLYSYLYSGYKPENVKNANENVKKINEEIKRSGKRYIVISEK